MPNLHLEASFFVQLIVLAVGLGGFGWVLKDRLDAVVKTIEKNQETNLQAYKDLVRLLSEEERAREQGDERERTARETAVQESRDLAHRYGNETQVAINRLTLEFHKIISDVQLKHQQAINELEKQNAQLTGRLEQLQRDK